MITGATGFVGNALCRALVGENSQVRVLLRNPELSVNIVEELRAQVVMGDLDNPQSLIEACADIDVVFHLAGMAHVSVESEQQSYAINVVGTKNLLSAVLEQKVGRIVYLSSSLAHAAEIGSGDVTEYGRQKLAAEKLIEEAAARNKLEAVILRAVNVYGVGMKGNIAGMINLIRKGYLPPLPALSSRISLLGVEDLAAALLLAARRSEAAGKTYTVTDGQTYPIAAIEEAIYRCLNKALPRWRTPAVILYAASAIAGFLSKLGGKEGSISTRTYRNLTTDNLFENASICAELGFVPSSSFYQALPAIVEHQVAKD